MKLRNFKGLLILLITALIWGLGFAAQSEGGYYIGAFTMCAARSYIAGLFLLSFFPLIRKKEVSAKKEYNVKKTVIGGIVCGCVICLAMNLQQLGIASYPDDAAAAGRSSFITALYIILVPIISVFAGKKVKVTVAAAAVIAVFGMFLLCFNSNGKFYISDLIVFLCSVSFSFHIIVVEKFSKGVNGIRLSCIQFFTCAVISTVFMLIFEKISISSIISAAVPILYLGIMSSGVAYTLQIIGQQYLKNPTVASIAMSFESVFGAIGGWLIQGKALSGRELIGCIIVFAAILFAQIPDRKKSIEL